MFKYIKVVWRALPSIIWAYFSWIIRYSKHPQKYPLEVRFKKVQKLIIKVLKAFDLRIENEELKEFYKTCKKDESYLIVCNHLGDIDPLLFIACAQRPITFVSKIENEKVILVGRIIRILNGDFMDRDDLRQSLKVMKSVENKLKSDEICDYMIFPEGTRNKNYKNETLLPYHHGTFRPAFKANRNIAIFGSFGAQRILSIKDDRPYYYVQIKLVEVIDKERFTNTNTVDLANEVMNKTKIVVDNLMQIDSRLMS